MSSGGGCPATTTVSSSASGSSSTIESVAPRWRPIEASSRFNIERTSVSGWPCTMYGAEGDPDLGHHGCGQHPAADDVADHERKTPVVELEDVVPVPADLHAGAGRQVLGA